MRPKVSVIIPVFNSAPYLQRCLDSLLGQSLADIEIICINDASTDDSPAILREYAKADARIAIIDLKENHGPAGARNVALPLAKGAYVGFVDSDDYIDPDFYQKLFTVAAESGADIVKGVLHRIVDGKSIAQLCINSEIRQNKYYFRSEFSTAIYNNAMFRKYNMAFLQGILCSVDLPFLLQAVSRAKSVLTLDDAFYNYCRRADSTDSLILSLEKIKSTITAAYFMVDYINALDVSVFEYLIVFNGRFDFLRLLQDRVSPQERVAAALLRAEALLALWTKCKYKEAFIAMNPRYVHNFLLSGDVEALAAYLQKSRAAQLVEDLRSRTKKAVALL